MTEFLVKINQGVLKGVPLKTELGDVITFNGIPYAEPPIGELRFKVILFLCLYLLFQLRAFDT